MSDGYDATNREDAHAHVRACQLRHDVATGLLVIDACGREMHVVSKTVHMELLDVPKEQLRPWNAALQAFMERYR